MMGKGSWRKIKMQILFGRKTSKTAISEQQEIEKTGRKVFLTYTLRGWIGVHKKM